MGSCELCAIIGMTPCMPYPPLDSHSSLPSRRKLPQTPVQPLIDARKNSTASCLSCTLGRTFIAREHSNRLT